MSFHQNEMKRTVNNNKLLSEVFGTQSGSKSLSTHLNLANRVCQRTWKSVLLLLDERKHVFEWYLHVVVGAVR